MSDNNADKTSDSGSDAVHSIYRKAVVIWVWAIQLVALPTFIPILGILTSVAKVGELSYQPLNAVNMAINIISLMFICLEITMYQLHSLNPKFYLASSVVKFVLGVASLGLLVFKVKEEWNRADGLYRILLLFSVGTAIFIAIAFLIALVYAATIMRQSARRWKGLQSRYLNPRH